MVCAMAKGRVILIDGSSMIFRAFYAIPGNFSTKDGLPTNATYGFALMFNKLMAGRTPDYGAVIFDAPGGSFRDEKYPAYKAQRPRMASELVAQLAWIDRLVEANRYPMFRVPGYEADDVIGTLSVQATEAGHEVIIVSADKDFAQLIGDDVRMFDAIRDVTYDVELVRKKWGVKPEQFVDLLALMGDKIDNIPGVAGIGQKGAATLLETYGSLAGVLDNVDSLKGRQKTALTTHRGDALLSRELATIDCQVPLPMSLADLKHTPPDTAELNALYRRLEFFSLLSEDVRAAQADTEQGAADYRTLIEPEDVARALDSLGRDRPVAVMPIYDLPHVVRGDWVGVALSDQPRSAVYVPLSEATWPAVAALLADPTKAKVAHGIKALYILIHRRGGVLSGAAGDTQLGSFLVDPGGLMPHRLEQVVKAYLQRTIRAAKSLTGSGQSERAFSAVDPAEVGQFACHLADAVGEVWPKVAERLAEEGQMAQLMEQDLPLAELLGRMELHGIKVDQANLAAMGIEFAERLAGYESRIYALAGREFNIASTKQLGAVLFDELKLPVIKRTKTGYSTNVEVLERLAPKHEIAAEIIGHRKLAKLINTYTDVLQRAVNPDTGRIHASFQQTVGVTGRLITTDPDLQRTPVKTPEGRRIREAFVAEPGHQLISADWSQIELRLLAHFSGDPVLVEAFTEGLDVHRRTASELFGCELAAVTKAQRDIGKTVNFATIYGQGATALGQILGIAKKDAQRYIEDYFKTYAEVVRWRDDTIARAHADGYVQTLFGRRRYIAELSSNSFMTRQAGERMAVNTPIQGSAADICKAAMMAIDSSMRGAALEAKMLLQVHDELVLEAPEAEVDRVCALVRTHMEGVHPLRVPLVVDVGVGRSWGEAH